MPVRLLPPLSLVSIISIIPTAYIFVETVEKFPRAYTAAPTCAR